MGRHGSGGQWGDGASLLRCRSHAFALALPLLWPFPIVPRTGNLDKHKYVYRIE